jgi:hypothetical protein
MPSSKPSKTPIVDMPSKKQLKELVRPYSDEELKLTPEQEAQLAKTMKLLEEYGIDFSKFKPEHISFITGKRAYPNYDQYQYIAPHHNIQKWLYAVKDITYKQKAGLPFREAVKNATNGWAKMEIYDFLNWLRFHEEGAHMKYKFAQVWYVNDSQPGYFLHVKPDAPKEPEPTSDGNAVNEVREEAERREEKRQMIEKQRAKIIGRLDSAEKLLRSPEGQHFAGDELESLMEAIYALKKKVQLVNKLSIATRLYEDMIVREGNILKRNGFVKAAEVLYSLAQSPGQSGEQALIGKSKGGALPEPPSPPDPSGAGQSGTMRGSPQVPLPGTPNAQTSTENDQNKDQPPVGALGNGKTPPPGTTTGTETGAPPDKAAPPGLNMFINNMNDGNKTETSKADDDNLEVHDDELMVTEAQAAPPPGPTIPPAALEEIPMTDSPPPERNPPAFIPPKADKPDKPKDAEEEPLEVTEDDIPTGAAPTSTFDQRMDELMQNVTIEDVVAELEAISRDYKTREQPRRLSYVDMMLDSLGLASMFPSLSEAQNKALEATNYISTRVDDILAKLRGAIASQEKSQLPAAPERPEVAGIRSKLQSDQDKEARRKQMRKEQESAELEGGPAGGKETPAVELGELGAAPAAPAPAAPPAPAAGPAPRPLG